MTMIGVDYFPEQWPRERWATDVQLMAEAGLTVVRIAEFTGVRSNRVAAPMTGSGSMTPSRPFIAPV